MSFLTFKTDDKQQEANSNIFLHAFNAGAETARQQTELASKERISAANQAAEDARTAATNQQKQTESLLKIKGEQDKQMREAQSHQLDKLEERIRDNPSNLALDATSRGNAESSLGAINILRGYLGTSPGPLNYNAGRLDPGTPNFTPQATAAFGAKQRGDVANSMDAVYKAGIEKLNRDNYYAEKGIDPVTGKKVEGGSAKLSPEFTKAYADLHGSLDTIQSLADDAAAKTKAAQALLAPDGKPQLGQEKQYEALTQTAAKANNDLLDARNNVRSKWNYLMAGAQLGLGGPELQDAVSRIQANNPKLDIFNFDNVPSVVSAVNKEVNPYIEQAKENGTLPMNDPTFLGLSKLGAMVGNTPDRPSLIDRYHYGVTPTPSTGVSPDIKNSGLGEEPSENDMRAAWGRRYPGMPYPGDAPVSRTPIQDRTSFGYGGTYR